MKLYKKNISKTANAEPDEILIRISARGVDTNLSPSGVDFENIVDSIKSKKLVILFKWFWKHSDVARFSNEYAKNIDLDNLAWYFSELLNVTDRDTPLHWMERINLFHVYGLLCRFNDKKYGLRMLEGSKPYKRQKNQIKTMSDLSARTVGLMLKESDADDSLSLLESISDLSLLAVYGMYQIHYYGGFESLLDILIDYSKSFKQVVIPQTVAGLFLSEPTSLILSNKMRERIYDDVLHDMPVGVIKTIEKIEKTSKTS